MVNRFFFYFPFFFFFFLLSPTRCLVSRTLWGGTVSEWQKPEKLEPQEPSRSNGSPTDQNDTLLLYKPPPYGMLWDGLDEHTLYLLINSCGLVFCAGRISVKGWNKEECSLHLQQGRHHTSNKFLEPLNSRLSIKRIYNRISLKWNKIAKFSCFFCKQITTVLLFCIWLFGSVFGIWECVLCNEDITDGVT